MSTTSTSRLLVLDYSARNLFPSAARLWWEEVGNSFFFGSLSLSPPTDLHYLVDGCVIL